jgi:hypothetical protein
MIPKIVILFIFFTLLCIKVTFGGIIPKVYTIAWNNPEGYKELKAQDKNLSVCLFSRKLNGTQEIRKACFFNIKTLTTKVSVTTLRCFFLKTVRFDSTRKSIIETSRNSNELCLT